MGRRPATSRADVVAAAAGLIADQGVAGLQIAAVAQRLGVAVGTVYNHVPSKEALLSEVKEVVEQRFVDRLSAVAPPDVPLLDAVPALADTIVELSTVTALVPRLLAVVSEDHDGDGTRIRAWMADRVRVAIDREEIPRATPELVAAMTYASVGAALAELARGVSSAEIRDLIERVMRALLRT